MFDRDNNLLPTADQNEDPRVWLEGVEDAGALDWVRSWNAHATSSLGDPKGSATYTKILEILDSKEKIPYVGRVLDGLYYNFWQDDVHVKGIWRRCTLAEYRKEAPAWEVVLDLDALGKAEGITWVWAGSTVLDEGAGVAVDRVLLKLSNGGSDASHVREFDLKAKAFVSEADGGFVVGEAKTQMVYKDRDTLLIGTDLGEGSLTDSGYPRTVREWKRGTKLADAPLVFEGKKTDVLAFASYYRDRHVWHAFTRRMITFWTSEHKWRTPSGEYEKVPVQEDAKIDTFADQLLVELRSAWEPGNGKTYAAGSLLAVPLAAFMGGDFSGLVVLFEPTASSSLAGHSDSYNYLMLEVLDDVKCELRFWRYTFPEGAATGGKWKLERTHRGAGVEQLGARASDANSGDEIWITSTSYTSPTTYARAEASAPQKAEVLKALPSFFDASGLHVQQFFATSTDGTKVPYFLVSKKAMKLDGSTPTLLYGYGGFEISLTPQYIATVGVGWLEQGGAYVQANIRGGGEYGPQWHQAALKEKRHKAYEDFEAVAKDLVARGVTSAARLGCHGGSNGGLLTGNMLVRSPELFGAIVCQVPLLDMRRFNKLLAGASWMGEYGDPDDPKQWEFVQKYSPYHRLGRGVTYPPILFTTSTRDDRVHPGHARKMVKKMSELQAASVYYYENVEGGHGGAADNKQRAFMSTLIYSFLAKTLRDGEIQPAASATKVPLRARIDPRAVTMAAGAVLLGWLAVVEHGRR